MSSDKTRPGLIYPSPWHSPAVQRRALTEAGAGRIIDMAGRSWRDLLQGVRVIRSGDVVYIYALVMVPTKRGDDDLPPTVQAGEFIAACHEAGAEVVEVLTGRRSSVRAQRTAMISDAVKQLRQGAGRRAPKGHAKIGRPGWIPTAAEIKTLRVIWRSREYANSTDATAAVCAAAGVDVSASTVRRILGKRR